MVLPQSQDISLLLQVFSQGLIKNLISREEVIAWADDLITHTNEPDYFLIEISLSHNKNDLIEAINTNLVKTESPIPTRVLIGLIYKMFFADKDVSTDDVMMSIHALSNLSVDFLTSYETNALYEFDDYDLYYTPDSEELHTNVLNFTSTYKSFSLERYEEWEAVNIEIEAALADEEIKNELIVKSFYEAEGSARRQQITDSSKKALYRVLALIAIVVGSILALYLIIQFVTDYSKPNAHHEYIACILTLIWMIWRLKDSFFNKK